MKLNFEMSKIATYNLLVLAGSNQAIFEHAQKPKVFDTMNFEDKMEEFREK